MFGGLLVREGREKVGSCGPVMSSFVDLSASCNSSTLPLPSLGGTGGHRVAQVDRKAEED